jgi:hypothetical protein
MKTKLVKESLNEMNFEKVNKNPLSAVGIGENRFKKPGDEEIGNKIFVRKNSEGNGKIFINKETGEEMEVGLYAASEVIKALKFALE